MNSTSCPPLCLLLGIHLQDPIGWDICGNAIYGFPCQVRLTLERRHSWQVGLTRSRVAGRFLRLGLAAPLSLPTTPPSRWGRLEPLVV